jgi:hypothetical protein
MALGGRVDGQYARGTGQVSPVAPELRVSAPMALFSTLADACAKAHQLSLIQSQGLSEQGNAKVAKLADAPDLGSGGATHGGSSPPFRTNRFADLSSNA